jgi:hypothetical protein
MNRRRFLATSAAVAVMPVSLIETGCAFSVTGTINTIISALNGILTYVAGAAPWVADLQAALQALQSAETNWKAGNTPTLIIDALNTVEAVLAVIPFTAVYSPLIDIVVAGIEAIINYFAPQTVGIQYSRPRATILNNPHKDRVALKEPHLFQSQAGAWKAQYNDAATGLGLSQLKVA